MNEKPAQFLLKDRNLKGDKTLAIREILIDNDLEITETYPMNPNGSPLGIAGVTTPDGRFTAMMPHPERVFRTVQNPWHPPEWNEDSPWMKIFRNAKTFLETSSSIK